MKFIFAFAIGILFGMNCGCSSDELDVAVDADFGDDAGIDVEVGSDQDAAVDAEVEDSSVPLEDAAPSDAPDADPDDQDCSHRHVFRDSCGNQCLVEGCRYNRRHKDTCGNPI